MDEVDRKPYQYKMDKYMDNIQFWKHRDVFCKSINKLLFTEKRFKVMRSTIKCLYLILPMIILITSCNSTNQTEKEYIKNLEEKNRLLEQEITDLKNNTKNIQSVKTEKVADKDYFTIGSPEKKVFEVMGNPTGYDDRGRFGKVLWFGLSTVKLENGKVIGYDNLDGNLKVSITE